MKYIATTPVCDLRKNPLIENLYKENQDLNQESQVLYGERLNVLSIENNWAFVEALDQKKFKNEKWVGYPGWVEVKNITPVKEYPTYNLVVQKPFYNGQFFSVGTRLLGVEKLKNNWLIQLHSGQILSVDKSFLKEISSKTSLDVREDIISHAKSFVNAPYHWGGRSSHFKNHSQKTSLDCSALTHLCYLVENIHIPRDAHDQYLTCKEIDSSCLKKADFIFLRDCNKDRMNHVMLYIEDDFLLEATIDPGLVRVVTAKEKLGKELLSIKANDTLQDVVVTFGTVF